MQANKLLDLGGKVGAGDGRIARHRIPDGRGARRDGLQALVISARKQHELDAASAALRKKNIEALTVANDLDAATVDAAASLVGAVLDHYGKIDILVNNAGTVWGASAIEHSPEAWRKVMGLERRCVL